MLAILISIAFACPKTYCKNNGTDCIQAEKVCSNSYDSKGIQICSKHPAQMGYVETELDNCKVQRKALQADPVNGKLVIDHAKLEQLKAEQLQDARMQNWNAQRIKDDEDEITFLKKEIEDMKTKVDGVVK